MMACNPWNFLVEVETVSSLLVLFFRALTVSCLFATNHGSLLNNMGSSAVQLGQKNWQRRGQFFSTESVRPSATKSFCFLMFLREPSPREMFLLRHLATWPGDPTVDHFWGGAKLSTSKPHGIFVSQQTAK